MYDGRAIDLEYVIFLVYYDFELLVFRFLLYVEESLGYDFFNGYLDIKNIFMIILDFIFEIFVVKFNY